MSLARANMLGSEKSLIITPAYLRNMWYRFIQEYYKTPPQTVVIGGHGRPGQLNAAANPDTKMVIASYDAIASGDGYRKPGTEEERYISPLLADLAAMDFDTAIFDEAHYITGYQEKTKRSLAAKQLAAIPSLQHLLLLTGTPVDQSIDMDMYAHLLEPDTYTNPGSFSRSLRRNPRLMHNALLSKIVRRKAEEVIPLPEWDEQTVSVELTPTQRAVYDFIKRSEPPHQLQKLANLQAAVLQPGLVKNLDISFDAGRLQRLLGDAYIKWTTQYRRDPNLTFNSDFLVQNGYQEVYLAPLTKLRGGINEIVQQYGGTIVREAWKGEVLPAKFTALTQLTRERLALGEKVAIISGGFVQGITKEVFDEEGAENEHYQYLLKLFQEQFGAECIVKLDGDDETEPTIVLPNGTKISRREEICRRFQNDKTIKILILNAAAAAHGNDLAISDRNFTGVSHIFESKPLSLPRFQQIRARGMSDKQTLPLHYFYIEAENTLEPEKTALLNEKDVIAGMLLDAVALTPEEEAILDDSAEDYTGYFARMVRSPRQNVTTIFTHIVGRPTEQVRDLLMSRFTSTQTVEEYLSENYDEVYKHGYAGYTAQVIKQVIEGLSAKGDIALDRIADYGSGPAILARTLQKPVYSLDISQKMLQHGQQKLAEEGLILGTEYFHQGSLTEIPKDIFADESITLAVCSLVLDCTPPEDRLTALRTMANTLTPGGTLILTIPNTELDAEGYYAFLEGLKTLGLEDNLSLSGHVRGDSQAGTIFNTWLYVVQKISAASGINTSDNMLFTFEKESTKSKKKQEKRLQRIARVRGEKAPAVDRFSISVPNLDKTSDQWAEKGELHELVSDSVLRYLLDKTDGELLQLGWAKEFIIKDGTQQIRLTRK